MKYVHLDNFRFLTGHGKEFAEAVDMALQAMEVDRRGSVAEFMDVQRSRKSNGVVTLDSGDLVVGFSKTTRKFDFYYLSEREAAERAKLLPSFVGYSNEISGRNENTGKWRLICVLRTEGLQPSFTSVPFPTILSTAKDYTRHYQVYMHCLVADQSNELISDPNSYVGVTKRGWRQRWREHVRSSRCGSHYKFHEAIRRYPSASFMHGILGLYLTEEEAMGAEERMVAENALYPKGLNMIPGGYAGMRFLHRIGAVEKGEKVSPDQKHEFINRFFEVESRAGRPNPFAAANWMNDDYAEKVICAAPNRLKPSQIRDARYLNSLGVGQEQIALDVGARNVLQISRLLDGTTYSRIH